MYSPPKQTRFKEPWELPSSCECNKPGLVGINPLAYTDVPETARLARSINTQPAVRRNSETNPTSQHNRGMYVLKSIKINFASIKYKCTKLPFSPKN
jgi:hypothetical protein